MTNKLSEIEMYGILMRYCGTMKCDDCRFFTLDGQCRWDEKNPKSTEECYRFLVNEGLIEAPDDAEVNFIKVKRNDEVEQKNDAINHPSHYTYGGIECIDAIKGSMPKEKFAGYCKGNVMKYVFRYELKGGVEDLRKARVYLDWLIETEVGNGNLEND